MADTARALAHEIHAAESWAHYGEGGAAGIAPYSKQCERTTAIITDALRTARNDALEEAINLCIATDHTDYALVNALRALKDRP